MITIEQQRRIWLSALLFLAMTLVLATGAFGRPYFLIDSEQQWGEALFGGKVIPMTESEWNDPQNGYMKQWNDPANEHEGPPYPPNRFSPPELYVYGGGGGGGYPEDAGLVMVWRPQLPGDYSSAWKYNYGVDPNLNNCTINITVTAPQFDMLGNQMNVVSFGIQDGAGFIRAWYWNCGPGNPIPWNVPTTITINTALIGVAAATPVATAYVNNPGCNLANSLFFIVDENAQWVGGPTPVPPPGFMLPGIWNYWHNLVVSQNIAAKCNTPTKWSQPVVEVIPSTTPPTFNGWDEKSLYYQQPICADDWKCIDERPVTDIHWWGSFVGWDQPFPAQLPQQFHIGFWDDVPDPDGPGPLFSHPGKLIHEIWCSNYVWNFAGYDRDPRGQYQNEACFQFNQWLEPSEYFYQRPNPATGYNIYWLSIAAVYPTTPQYPWGWKTRPHFYNDDAVRINAVSPQWPPTIGSQWANGTEIQYPNDVSWDLAFELTTQDTPPKWRQQPDLTTTGIDVKATRDLILADDFQCTKQTKVTDITVWGSWLDDILPQNDPSQVTFTLSIHDDIPDPDGTGSKYSKPGNMLWSGNFGPGQFTVSQHAMNLMEGWWDPSVANSYDPSGDTVCWMYDFDIPPADAFCQEGSETNPKVYWLDVQATPIGSTTAQFGWKTSSSPHWNDDAVWDIGTDCVLPDNGSGTADLPPVGCEYSTPDDDMRIRDGLPTGATIEIDATHGNFVCSGADGVCSFTPGCRQSGGSLGGEKECFDSQLLMPMVGTGSLAGFSRSISLPVSFEVHTAPRTLGAPVQSFNTDMFRLFGQINNIGDPDFDLLRVVAGTDFGLSSPGHTTLTQQPGGNWAVDSFFDITYRIDFVGSPGGALAGLSGSTTGTVRFQTGGSWKELRYPPNHPMSPQSIDLAFEIDGNQPCDVVTELDFGDAPDPTYPTLLANDGARHVLSGVFLGALIDAEADGQPVPAALGDDINGVDDEDGVVFTSPLVPGNAATVEVTASVAGQLDAWIDFNQDGDWTEANEQIFASGLAAGLNSLSFTVPAGASSGDTFARFRYSSAGGLSYTGPATDGEVEDYQVAIWCYKWEQPPDLSPEGFDVMATYPFILADDFRCDMQGPITDIHVYGSWFGDQLPFGDANQVVFTLSLHLDIPDPDGPGSQYSRPGNMLWSRTFTPGQFTVRPYQADLFEGWLTPPDIYEPFADTICWRYDFYLNPNEFFQEGTPANPVTYWLDVQAQPLDGITRFGWKTSTRHWNDDAVWGQGTDCVAQDNGSGTASLPPPCPYDGSMGIVDGLEPGGAIEIDTQIGNYSGQSEVPGGSLGGMKQTYNAVMPLNMTGTGWLAGYNHFAQVPVVVESHSAPRGGLVQSFDTDMFRIQGQLPIGDPDFDLLRISAGTAFGMPSPGHTTLTQQLGGNWAVDSFFDITYRIDFVGAPGGPLAGRSGSTTATVRFQTADPWNELRYPPQHPRQGQSVDLAFDITGDCWQQPDLDYGDAPDPTYPTLLAKDGARHVLSGVFLGALIDAEADGQPTAFADGDDVNGLDDEDGVVFTTPLTPGSTANVNVTASAPGLLSAWIDFNADGSWATLGDQIFVDFPLGGGLNTLMVSIPAGASTGSTYARFRLSNTPGLSYTGLALDGEVEDYRVPIYKKVNKGAAKKLTIGSFVLIEKNVVTAKFDGVGWYFEEPDRGDTFPGNRGRSAGLGVLPIVGAASPWTIGQVVSAYGYTTLNGCELMLQEEGSWLEADTLAVATMVQNNRDSGGGVFGNQPGMTNVVGITPDPDIPAFGLNTVASLVTLLGRCTCVEEIGGVQTNFWIDDGSNLWDGNTCGALAPARGVKVRIPAGYAGPPISTQSYYVVTGIMRTDSSPAEGECVRWLWPRFEADIVRVL